MSILGRIIRRIGRLVFLLTLLVASLAVVIMQYPEPAAFRDRFLPLEPASKARIPPEAHVEKVNAVPSAGMIRGGLGRLLKFRVLDKRTLRVTELEVMAGQSVPAPWGGQVAAEAFVPDLVIRDHVAIHGPKGHTNPAVWVHFTGGDGETLFRNWLFARDAGLTAWDHHRFDISFVGVVPPPKEPETPAPAETPDEAPVETPDQTPAMVPAETPDQTPAAAPAPPDA